MDLHQLRHDNRFIDPFLDIIFSNIIGLELRFAHMFVQRFLTSFIHCFIKRRVELLDINCNHDVSLVSDNDRHVLFYICGFIIHALKKRYMKRKDTAPQLLVLLDSFYADNNEKSSSSEWTEMLDRGGLKKPCNQFFVLFTQVERWIREVIDGNKLHANSLVDLKDKLIEYRLLRVSWEQLISDDDTMKWILLEHALGLFLKIRGFAVTRL